jgi:hypothetical protein
MSDGISKSMPKFMSSEVIAAFDPAISDVLMDEMNVPVKAGDNKGAQERFHKVRDLLNILSPEKAGELLDHLSKGIHDPLAQKILHTFSNASVEKLKGDLRALSGQGDAREVKQKGDGILRSPEEKKARKGETELQGQLKSSQLKDLYIAGERSEKMHKASDVMHKDPDAILSALGNLTASQMKELQKIFPEKYGISLDTFLKKELQGSKLNVALDMVRSGNTVGATDFRVVDV